MREVFRHKRVAGRLFGTGTTMGICPAWASSPRSSSAYTYAQKTSKTPEQFGKGSPEGLIASRRQQRGARRRDGAAAGAGHPGRGADRDDAVGVLCPQCRARAGAVPEPDGFRRRALSGALAAQRIAVVAFLLVSTNRISR
jgi:putative tricarboxylic transport membrane protein